MATTTIKNGAGSDVVVELPLAPGQAARAASRPVTLATEDVAAITGAAIPAGSNAIGTVGVTALPALVAGSALIGDVAPAQRATTNGLTSSRVLAAATTNATSLKASAGRIARIDLFNTAASLRYLKLYDKASAPTVGTDTPVWTIPLPPGSGFSSDFPFGKYLATGIAYAITAALADGDTTAVAAGDVTGSIDWI